MSLGPHLIEYLVNVSLESAMEVQLGRLELANCHPGSWQNSDHWRGPGCQINAAPWLPIGCHEKSKPHARHDVWSRTHWKLRELREYTPAFAKCIVDSWCGTCSYAAGEVAGLARITKVCNHGHSQVWENISWARMYT